jgi:hypothetical protein
MPTATQPHVAALSQPQTLALLQPEHGEAHTQAQHQCAGEVEPRRTALVSDARPGDEDERDDRDRDVDPEDRPPRPLREVAAGDRPDRGHGPSDGVEDGQRLAAFVDFVDRDDNGQRGREQKCGEGALDNAKDDDPRLADRARRRRPAQHRGDREADDSHEQRPAMAEDVGQLAAEGEEGREREQIAVDDPLRARGRQRQVLLEPRDRDGDDRLVDEHHRHRGDHGGEDQALAPSAAHDATLSSRLGVGKRGAQAPAVAPARALATLRGLRR